MNNRILFIAAFVFMVCNCYAQTGLFTYDGGFFIKNGNSWEEYRPNDKDGVWSLYNQYNEDSEFYSIKNEACSLNIPKNKNNDIQIYVNKKWNVIYKTKEVYDFFNDNSRLIYCYDTGYFVRDGQEWREYIPGTKKGVWANYTQYDEDDNYFMIENSSGKMSIPKRTSNDFYLLDKNEDWSKCYNSVAVYDASSYYDFIFKYPYYKVEGQNKELEMVGSPAVIKISRTGNGMISYEDNNYPFSFKRLCMLELNNSDIELGFKIMLDNNEYLAFIDNYCIVNVKSLCPYMNFLDCTDSAPYISIKNKIRADTFFK